MICAIPPKLVKAVWPQMEPFVAAALKKTDCDLYLPSDIRQYIRDGRMVAFVDYDGDIINGLAITEILVFPQIRVCNIPFVGGRNMKSWMKPMLEAIKTYAREAACERLMGGGRKGWIKAAGFHEYSVTVALDLDDA